MGSQNYFKSLEVDPAPEFKDSKGNLTVKGDND